MFDSMFFHVRRRGENLLEQTKNSFAIAVDAQNRRSGYGRTTEKTTIHLMQPLWTSVQKARNFISNELV